MTMIELFIVMAMWHMGLNDPPTCETPLDTCKRRSCVVTAMWHMELNDSPTCETSLDTCKAQRDLLAEVYTSEHVRHLACEGKLLAREAQLRTCAAEVLACEDLREIEAKP